MNIDIVLDELILSLAEHSVPLEQEKLHSLGRFERLLKLFSHIRRSGDIDDILLFIKKLDDTFFFRYRCDRFLREFHQREWREHDFRKRQLVPALV